MQHSESITIQCPLGEVWAMAGDPHAWGKWIKGITDVKSEESGTLAAGKALSFAERGKARNMTVIEYEAGRIIRLGSTQKGYDFNETIALVESAGATEVTLTMGLEPTVWWASFLALFMQPINGLVIGRPLRKTLQALSAALESQAE